MSTDSRDVIARSRTTALRPILLASVAGLTLASAAFAQPAGPGGINFWINPSNGSWFDSLAWGGVLPSQGGVPDLQTTASITGNTQYQIDLLNSAGSCHHLFINNPLATLLIAGVIPGNPASLTVHGTQWDSTGTVRVGFPGSQSDSTVRINNNITIAGSGTIRLDAQSRPFGAVIAAQSNQGFLLINGAGHTISGEGRISVRLQNNGVVRADVPSRAIVLDASFLTENNGTMSATGGGLLQLNTSGGIQQGAGGAINVGNASELQIFSVGTPGFTGGTITTTGTGRVLIATQGAKMNDLTLSSGSLMTFQGNSGLAIGPQGMRNFGTISTGPSGFVVSDFASTTTISGTGRLQLEGGELARFGSGGGYAMTNAADHTIGGHGSILLTLTNFGTVLADRNGQSTGPTDIVLQQGTKFNSGSMIARNGGRLLLQQSVIVDQTAFGTLHAENASAVVIETASVIGGRLTSSGSGVIAIGGSNNIIESSRLTAGSRAVITCAATALTRGTVNIDGTLEVRNDGCGPNFATLRAALGSALNGGGTIRLLPTAGSNNVNIISEGTSAAPIGLGLGLTIAGHGTLSGPINSQATLSPDLAHLPVNQGGGPIGTFSVSPGAGSAFRVQNLGRFECDIASTSSFDRVTISGTGVWNGTVHARFIGPTAPAIGTTYDVLTATSLTGVAGLATAEGLPADRTVRADVLADRLRLTIRPVCTQSDVAGPDQSVGADGVLTADDIIVFLGWYFAGDTRADVAGANQSTTPDGQFTADDIIVFLGRYFAGC
jgi:hypothetical protein